MMSKTFGILMECDTSHLCKCWLHKSINSNVVVSRDSLTIFSTHVLIRVIFKLVQQIYQICLNFTSDSIAISRNHPRYVIQDFKRESFTTDLLIFHFQRNFLRDSLPEKRHWEPHNLAGHINYRTDLVHKYLAPLVF